jgi:hypothetical protein
MRDLVSISVIRSLLQAGPAEVRWTGAGLAMVGAAIADALTGVLVAIMLVLFGLDVLVGVLRAVHVGGLKAFSRDRFGRAFIKLMAAMCGILLGAAVDLLLQHYGVVEQATPVTTGVLGYMCCGFGFGAAQHLGHFFPGIDSVVAAGLRKIRDPELVPQRREGDDPQSVER